MSKYGLKLWSTNNNYVGPAIQLYESSVYDYIELYIVPDSYKQYMSIWSDLDIPFIIHAPHYMNGMCLSERANEEKNLNLASEAFNFADNLSAKHVIFHPGINGDVTESARQLNLINDDRIVIENKPYFALNDLGICRGATIEEMTYLLNETSYKFCLDIGHAICSANGQKLEPLKYLQQLLTFNPKIIHLSDGYFNDIYDKHLNFGDGDFPLKKISEMIKNRELISIETNKKSLDNLLDFEKDMQYLKRI